MTNAASPIEVLNNAVSNHNPFKSGLIVRNQDVWGEGFPDVPSLNAHASSAVFEAIEQIRKGQRQAVGMTIKAEKGLGKSHIISRIRNQLKMMGGTLFVYMADYSNLNRIKPEFLKMLALSLKQVGSQGVMQWQELATSLINEAFQKSYTPKQIVLSIPHKLVKQPNLIECLTQKVLEARRDVDNPDLIQAILLTLSPQHAPFAINWLAGKSLSQAKADQLNLSNPSDEDRDFESFDTICQILDLISHYNALIVCFDQLEGVETNDGGFTKAQVIANLGMDLYNRLKRGVLLTAMYPDIWVHHIRAMPTAEAVIDRIGEQIIELKYLNPDDVIALVSCRLQEFYKENQLTPPHPLYPFEESKLKELGKQRATARDVLQWCQKNWSVPDIVILTPPPNPVEAAFMNEMKSLDDEEFMDDKSRVAKALILGFRSLIGDIILGVKVVQVNNAVLPKSHNKDFIDFKIIAEENGKTIKIGVCVLPYSAGVGIQAGLSRLVDYEKFDLTRGCLVRSKAIPPKARKAQEYLKELLEKKGGEWVALKAEEIKPLIAILAVYENSSDYDLNTEQIFDFINQRKLSTENPLLLEILSDPSGQVPQNVVDEEAAVEVPIEADESTLSAEAEVDLGEIAA